MSHQVDLGEVCMDLRGQLLEEKEAEVEAKKRALDEREMREGGDRLGSEHGIQALIARA